MKIEGLEWTSEWPTKAGLYFYYGGFSRPDSEPHKPSLQWCRVAKSGNDQWMYTTAHFLYKSEQHGLFTTEPIEVEVPSLTEPI